ncbi:diacylglycerol kinase family lipid kinase [candidate division KSB1 bacterium]|nr:diacylglycerol kinase family lipid kinase [candidate division KSB1 bacterium]
MKLLLLVNPIAGRKQGFKIAAKAIESFRQNGISVVTRYSDFPGHLTEIAQQEVNGSWDGIIAAGGDGTLFEIVNGMMAGNERLPVPLGVIPVGTGNSFSRDLSIKTLNDAVTKILSGKTRSVDLGKCECAERIMYFINLMGFGFVSDVAWKASFYKSWGALSYIFGVFIITRNLQSYRLDFDIDGRQYRRDNVFVEICNSQKTGGDMIMAPQAKIDDGLLDVVILNKISRLGLLQALPKIFKGTHIYIPQVETFTGRQMSFLPDTAKILTPDGEITGHTPITVSVLPGKIRIFDT